MQMWQSFEASIFATPHGSQNADDNGNGYFHSFLAAPLRQSATAFASLVLQNVE
jgi:hypothetical protein